MHILITGAASMLGRKLANFIAQEPVIAGRRVERMTLADIVHATGPASFSGQASSIAGDLSSESVARELVRSRPDVIFHLATIVSGDAEADFEKGYRVNQALRRPSTSCATRPSWTQRSSGTDATFPCWGSPQLLQNRSKLFVRRLEATWSD